MPRNAPAAGLNFNDLAVQMGPSVALLFGSAVLGAFFDNVPYVATMAPIVQDIVATAPDPETGRSPWWSFALGADGGWLWYCA